MNHDGQPIIAQALAPNSAPSSYTTPRDTIPDDDEPPFPVGGLISILRPIAALSSITNVFGDLVIHVEVDSEGKPRKADLLVSPTPDFGLRAIASVMNVTYKPGKCHGVPCVMSIPLRIALVQGGNG